MLIYISHLLYELNRLSMVILGAASIRYIFMYVCTNVLRYNLLRTISRKTFPYCFPKIPIL